MTFMVGLRSLLLVCALVTPAAAAECHVRGQPWLEGRILSGDAGATGRAVDARVGQEIDVFVLWPGTLAGKAVVFGDDGRPGHVSWTQAGCGPLRVAWSRVEPRMQHERLPAPNPDLKIYANAVVFGPRHGAWLGYDRLEYLQTPLPGAGAEPVLRVRDARPGPGAGVPARGGPYADLGVMRLAATLEADGQRRETPGAADAPAGQIGDRVFRYTYRGGDDFLGWLTTFFNVPYLFGSAGQGGRSQAERYIGADCADVLVAALRRAGHRRLDYTSVTGLVSALRKVGGPVIVRPCPAAPPAPLAPSASAAPAPTCAAPGDPPPLAIGEKVRPGDLLALDYVGAADLPRDWDHIGVLAEDRGPGGAPDGVLGPEDLFLDSGDGLGLKLAPLGDQGAVRVMALRP